MQTQSILLIRDAISVLDAHSTNREARLFHSLIVTDSYPLEAEGSSGQRESCHRLALALGKFSDNLMENLQQFIKLEDSNGVGTIWTCCITCLAHLAALYHLISQTEPALKDTMDDFFDLTLVKLGSLSLEVHIEEYSHFDILTGVCIFAIFSDE